MKARAFYEAYEKGEGKYLNHRLGVVAGVFHFGPDKLYGMRLSELKFWYDRAIAFMKWTMSKRR
jgi:hypothetical protein